MGLISKAGIALSTFRQSGVSGVIRRFGKSQRLQWYRWRGQRLNYRLGWRTKRPILVIESDDWGSEHIPGPKAIEKMKEMGLFLSDSHGMFDSLETADDIDKLCDILNSHKDGDGNPAVMTANFIMANPDYVAIRESNYSSFKAKPIYSGWNHEPDAKTMLQKYREGINCGVIVPQLHGMLHFCPDVWMENLCRGDPETLKAFDLQMIGEKEDASGIGIQSMSPIYHESGQAIRQLVREGIETFRSCFNIDSFTTIAPCYCWRSDETEQALLACGIRVMQGKEYQYLPDGSVRPHYIGQRGPGGILYMVRNCVLEPISAGTTVEQCISQIEWAFQHSLPAVLCSHRTNYTSRVATEVRDKGLAVLDGVLKQVKEKFGDVEFLSSDKLALRILSERQTNNLV